MHPETPEFYLMLDADDIYDDLADKVYEAGFDDSAFLMRNGHAAVWIRRRPGQLEKLVKEALAQAEAGGLDVLHVEVENAVFA